MPADLEVEKREKLAQIEALLKRYGGELEISEYVLRYLSLEELDKIIAKLVHEQEHVIENNREWLAQLRKKLFES